MKKIYAVLSVLLLLTVLTVGMYSLLDKDETFSASENRALKSRPKLTFSNLLNGKYAEDFGAYFADTFPNREKLMSANRSLNGFYYFSGLSGKNDVQLSVGFQSGGAHGGEALKPTDAPTAEPTDGSDSESDAPEPSVSAEPTEPPAPTEYQGGTTDAEVEDLGQAILIGNRAMDVPYGNYDLIEKYAEAVTAIGDALGSGVRTFNIAVPNAAEFYTPKEYHTGDRSQVSMIDHCYKHLGENIISVDAYSNLAQHTEEYIYFRTDHHWTQLGAYYAYTAFCKAAGMQPRAIEEFETGEYTGFIGSMYTYLSGYPQSQILANDPDTLYFYRPVVEAKARYYSDTTLSDEGVIGVISYIESSVNNKYLTYVGGDHPVVVVKTDVANDKVCLLIKESYGNAFLPWLTSHYSKIVMIDPREFNRDGQPKLDLAAFAAEQGVTDCIVLNYPMMLNSEAYISYLNAMVK